MDARVVEGQVRVEIANGHRFITEVVEALPGEQAANLLGDEREEREDRDEPEA